MKQGVESEAEGGARQPTERALSRGIAARRSRAKRHLESNQNALAERPLGPAWQGGGKKRKDERGNKIFKLKLDG